LPILPPSNVRHQVFRDLSTPKHMWDRPRGWTRSDAAILANVTVACDAYEAADGAHALAVLTEWDEFRGLDWASVYARMAKPAFVFDGRNVLDHAKLREMGFIVYSLGRPLEPFLRKDY
jgi:UDPglucose 6-dehydrogenase